MRAHTTVAYARSHSWNSVRAQAMVPIGMLYGAHVTVGDFIVLNLLPAVAGNMVGGGFLIGGAPCHSRHPRACHELACIKVCPFAS